MRLRSKFLLWAGIAASATLTGTAHAAGGTTVYEPASNWMLDYNDVRCRAARLFGSKEEPTLLILDQMEPSSRFSWMIAGEALDYLGSNKRLKVRFGDKHPEFLLDAGLILNLEPYGKAFRGSGTNRDTIHRSNSGTDETSALAQLDTVEGAGIEWIDFSRGNRRVRLETGNLDQIYAEMNKCVEDLVRHWGVDPAIQHTVVVKPKLQNFVAVAQKIQRHYPSRAMASGEQTDLHFRVTIGADGGVTSCKLTNLTATEKFGEKVCEIIEEHALFEPAFNQAGVGVPSYYTGRIAYRMN